ncbi:hypothetical protein ABIE62_000464 [Porphyrobacter sp. MBR-155]|jgi:hypothetical protein|uniref:TonB-dependent receptor n=1 Tax=Porphyrobacter sp. MBR-155 TaxID=3156464 RepID=UPI0033936E60
MRRLIFAMLATAIAAPLAAQDLHQQEIVVTASRVDQDDYSDFRPAVGLRRKADFLVQQVTIRGDSRDPDRREKEIRSMLANAIRAADKQGVELATGDYILTRLTPENADELELINDRRPDSERIDFLVKAPLGTRGVAQAQAAIKAFVEGVPEVGRAQMDVLEDPTLSIVGPDSYRSQIVALVADDAKRQAEVLGDGYGVELTGLNMPVQWAQSGPGEVLLFIPYELRIIPKR